MDNTLEKLLSISLIDGRNRDKLTVLKDYFSEYALIKYRIFVELEYLIFLNSNTGLFKKINDNKIAKLRSIYLEFNPDKAKKVKEIESKINHDVKAVEYYLQDSFKKHGLEDLIPFIHFGLTSYDINIPVYALILSHFKDNVLVKYLGKIEKSIKTLIIKTRKSVMLARTHGQPALPTTMGKELAVFYHRLQKEIKFIKNHKLEAKLTGAVGNFNALNFVAPQYDWLNLSRKFINSLDLVPNLLTTQILPYDNWIVLFDSLRRINSILLDLSQDIWWYISFEYFVQKKNENEVGSSTMSHKINPITFENAEGNLQLANSLLGFFANKLPVSRLQRDLSDSTVKRNFGLAFGFTLLAYDSLIAGFQRIEADNKKMYKDLHDHWEIFAEGIQTYLRSIGLQGAFEKLKNVTRGEKLTRDQIMSFIDGLPVSYEDKQKLKIENLESYLGLTGKIIDFALKNGKTK